MIVRLKLAIEQEEYSALLQLALSELRNPESQLLFILRKELKRRGLITGNINDLSSQSNQNSGFPCQGVGSG